MVQQTDNLSISFLMRYAEIQMNDYTLFYCTSTKQFNIYYPHGDPVCVNSTQSYNLTDLKNIRFNLHQINAIERTSIAHRSLDLLFFDTTQLTNPSVIILKSSTSVANLKKMLKAADRYRQIIYRQTAASEFQIPSADYYTQLYSDKIVHLSDSYSNNLNFTIGPLVNNMDLFDAHTLHGTINVYFSDLAQTTLGIVSFQYEIIEGAISTTYNSYSLSTQPLSNVEILYQIFIVLCATGLVIVFYLKTKELGKFSEVLGRSVFFVLFLVFFCFEFVFRGYHMLMGTNDYNNTMDLLGNYYQREVAIYYAGNVRILKGFGVIFLGYHLIYVVFNVKDLVVFTIFFKPVFQRFLIVLCVFILALVVLFNQFLGKYYFEFNNMKVSFFNILNYALGVNSVSITDDSAYPNKIKLLRFYFNIFNYVLRLLALNFSLVIIYYFYRKSKRNN